MGVSKERGIQMTRKPASKIIAFVTAVCTMAVMCGMPAVAFAWEGGITKEETVYVVTDSNGAQSDVIVSDHLVNNGKSKTIADETTLSDIENVKGEETFKQNGDALTWDAEGNSIYYQGKTDAEVPVTMGITYRLNDRVVSGPELQGKSGKVEIRIHYENNAVYEGTTVPFVVMTGLIVTDDSFKNIKISKGKVIDDGEKLLVVGMAAPGLAQTLGIGESELGIGSTVTITGEAKKFAVEDMMTIVTNAFFEDIDADSIEDLDYDDEIKQLDKGAKALVEGSDQLYEGLDALNDNMPALKTGVKNLKDGSDALTKGTNDAKKGAQDLADGVVELSKNIKDSLVEIEGYTGQFATGAKNLYEGLNVFKNGNPKDSIPGAVESLTEIKSGIDNIVTSVSSVKTLANQAYDKTSSAVTNNSNAIDNIKAAKTAAAEIQTSNPDTYAAIISALNAAETDIGKSSTDAGTAGAILKNEDASVNSIEEISDAVSNGATDLSTGIATLIGGINQYFGDNTKEETFIGGSYALWQGLAQMQAQIDSNLADDSTLSKGLSSLTKGSSDLAKGEVSLAGGAKQLADGMDKLYDKADTMVNGVYQLDNGAYKLRNGMSKLYKEGIKKIVDMYNDDLKGTLNDARSMLDAGKGYKTFTKLPSGMDGNVKFIYKTDMTE